MEGCGENLNSMGRDMGRTGHAGATGEPEAALACIAACDRGQERTRVGGAVGASRQHAVTTAVTRLAQCEERAGGEAHWRGHVTLGRA